MRKVIFKLAGANDKGDWFLVKLSGYYDAKTKTWYDGRTIFDESLYNSVEEGDIIQVK